MKKDFQFFKKEFGIDILDDFILHDDITSYFYLDLSTNSFNESPLQFIRGDFPCGWPQEKPMCFDILYSNLNTKCGQIEMVGEDKFLDAIKEKVNNIYSGGKVRVIIPFLYDSKSYFVSIYMRYFADKNIVLGSVRDSTENRKVYEELYSKSYKDTLTGLFNRNTCLYHLRSINKDSDSYFAMIDLNSFKAVNDYYGHDKGDQVLKMFAENLMKLVDNNIIFYRIGGDEFICQAKNITYDSMVELAIKINQCALNTSYGKIKITASIGFIKYSNEMTELDLLRYVDFAMYEAKRKTSKSKESVNCYAYLSHDQLLKINEQIK